MDPTHMQETTFPEQVDPIMERLEDQIAWYDRKSLVLRKPFDC
jgi:hypothetical protein